MHRFCTRRSKRKQSMSDKLDIGAGKYVHNVEFPCNQQNITNLPVGKSDGSLNAVDLSWSDNVAIAGCRYVTNLEYPANVNTDKTASVESIQCEQLGVDESLNPNSSPNQRLTVTGTSTTKTPTQNAPSAIVDLTEERPNLNKSKDLSDSKVDLSNLSVDILAEDRSSNHTPLKASDFAKGSSSNDKPNFTKLHEEYKAEWQRNPPPNETRPMRLFEFIWSKCDGSSNKLGVDYGSDDSKDVILNTIAKKKSKPLREIFAELDAKYDQKQAENAARIQKLCDSGDDMSFKSAFSNQSLVDFFDKNTDPILNINDSNLDISRKSSSSEPIEGVVGLGTAVTCTKLATAPTNHNDQNKLAPDGNQLISTSNKLHIPEGFSEIYHSSDSDDIKQAKLKSLNGYLTDSLEDEMARYYPKCEHITRDQLTNDVAMDRDAFSQNFVNMFPRNRIFLNYLQLREAVTKFMKHWNLLCKSNGKNFRCSYSHTPAKKKVVAVTDLADGDTDGNNDTTRTSTSSLVKCPFLVRWTLVDHKRPHRHDIFYKVKISSIVSTEHTCMMSHISFRHALKKTTGHRKIDLNSMNTAVSVLKMNPTMSAQMLRPILKDCLPSHTNIDCKFIDNFRRRVAIHHAKYPNQPILSMEQCQALSKTTSLTQSDYIGMNDPLIRTIILCMVK